MRGTCREIDHSGDVGLEAAGPDLGAALEALTRGLLELMAGGGGGAAARRPLEVAAGSDAELVVDWLNEVIAVAALHGEVYADASVRVADGRAVGWVAGERFDPARHRLRLDVKAATYHGLSVTRGRDGVRVRVVFDL